MTELPNSDSAAPQWIGWPSLWRGGLLALAIAFAQSTQLLFQFGLYDIWPLPDILLGWLDHFAEQLVVGACIFATIVAAVFICAKLASGRRLVLFTAIVLGALAGEAILVMQLPLSLEAAANLFAKAARWLVIAGLAYLFFVFQRQGAEMAAQMHQNELRRIQLDRQLTEARLHALRAQIEPHFLFNTLANVQRLYQTEPQRGRKMLGSFVAYLRAAMPRMRQDETTLGQEADLGRAYLDVLQVRMGERLRICFNIPQELAALPFPPLALSTLIENAVKHGLNPLPEGGTIAVAAHIEDRRIKVTVADTGVGLRDSGGTGSGLANLRARLAGLYGDAGSLAFEANAPRGIRATITVPVRDSAESSPA